MNFASILSLVSGIGTALFNLITEFDPALIAHNKNTIASATSALQTAGAIAPEVAGVVNVAAEAAAAVDPSAATAANDIASAANTVASAVQTLASNATAPKPAAEAAA